MSSTEKFSRDLVKGRIAETIFEQMYRDTGNFTVLEFGYEKIVPELVQGGYSEHDDIVDTLRTAPDFAVIDMRKKHVRLIEVKFRSQIRPNEILAVAERMRKNWNPSYLFVASLSGFYFGSIEDIINARGYINPLEFDEISAKIQQKYLDILREFEGAK